MEYRKLIDKLLTEIKEKSVDCFGKRLKSLVVFGSVANNLHTPESDIDILYILENFRGSYDEFMTYFSCVEEKLETLKELKKQGIYTFISPVFIDVKHLNVRMSIFWHTKFIILHDDGTFKNFLKELEKFKKEKLKFFEKPMPHFVVSD